MYRPTSSFATFDEALAVEVKVCVTDNWGVTDGSFSSSSPLSRLIGVDLGRVDVGSGSGCTGSTSGLGSGAGISNVAVTGLCLGMSSSESSNLISSPCSSSSSSEQNKIYYFKPMAIHIYIWH